MTSKHIFGLDWKQKQNLQYRKKLDGGTYQLIWSYILDYENSKNPFQERKEQIMKWKKYAIIDIEENTDIIKTALLLDSEGLQKMDSLHIAYAVFAKADYFLTTDDKVIRNANAITGIKITAPSIL